MSQKHYRFKHEKPISLEVGQKICELLGFDPDEVNQLTITLDAELLPFGDAVARISGRGFTQRELVDGETEVPMQWLDDELIVDWD